MSAIAVAPVVYSEKNYHKARVVALFAWFYLPLLAVVSIAGLRAPNPVPKSASADQFSAERALTDLKVIAGRPHPIGSEAEENVRAYLMQRLAALGATPTVFSGIGVANYGNSIAAGRVHDVVTHLNGTSSSGAVVLMAHYDSVVQAPGAADDGAGVAAILETVRALQSGPRLKNDVIVLLTDGEEAGLLGAEALASDPQQRPNNIGLILNFEARGNRGPSLLFETSGKNELVIKNVVKAAPFAVGSSLFYDLYKTLPNDTDFTIFRRLAVPGMNFAFGAGFDAYHSRLDTAQNLSLASLQHHGSYALALTRYFGQIDLASLRKPSGDAVFFDWFGSHLVAYSVGFVLPAQIVVTVLAAFLTIATLRNQQTNVKGLLFAFLGGLSLLVAVPLAMTGLWKVLSFLLAARRPFADSLANGLLFAGLTLFGFLIAILMLSWLRKRLSTQILQLAAILILSCISWVFALLLPSGSYLFFWPLALLTLDWVLVVWLSKSDDPAMQMTACLPSLTGAGLLFTPIAYLLYIFLTLQSIVVGVVGLLIAIAAVVAIPLLERAALPKKGLAWGVIALVVCSLGCCITGALLSHRSVKHPLSDSVFYSANASEKAARWISTDRSIDSWTAQFFPASSEQTSQPNFMTGDLRPVFASPAPWLSMPAPLVEIESKQGQSQIRDVRLTINSPRHADIIHLDFPETVHCLAVKIGGRKVPFQQQLSGLDITLYGMAQDQINVELRMHAPAGTSFWAMDETYGLPLAPKPRPDDLMPSYVKETTRVSRQYGL